MTLFSAVLLGYVVNTTTGGPGGAELHWNRSNVPYMFNDAGSRDLGPEVYPALEAGFQVWNDVSGIDYSYAGCTGKGRSSVIDGSGDAEPDNSSIVTWVESGWPYGPQTIAITWTYFFDDGEIGEADMLMNGDDYTWTVSDGGALTDVQSITAHESGHYLGLGHSSDPDATMYATVLQGETTKRSLDSDDISGAQYLYGNGPSGGALFDGECEGGGGGEGCGCSLEGTAGPRPGLFAGILSVLALALLGFVRLRPVTLPAGLRRAARRAAVPAAAVAAFLAAGEADATVMLDQSVEELAATSDTVVHGDVTNVETRTDGRVIWTVQTVRVRDTLAGLARPKGAEIEIVTPGGTLPEGVSGPHGYRGARAEGIPTFSVGEEVVVFAWSPVPGRLTVTALQQGKLNVRRDGEGRATVSRDLSGVVRMKRSEQGIAPVAGDELEGVALEDLVQRLRHAPTRLSPRP